MRSARTAIEFRRLENIAFESGGEMRYNFYRPRETDYLGIGTARFSFP